VRPLNKVVQLAIRRGRKRNRFGRACCGAGCPDPGFGWHFVKTRSRDGPEMWDRKLIQRPMAEALGAD